MKATLPILLLGSVTLAGCMSSEARDKARIESEIATTGRELQQICISEDIRPRLKDPESLRVLGKDHHSLKMIHQHDPDFEPSEYSDFVYITYTATNGFGGRVKSTRGCGFADGKTLRMGMDFTGVPPEGEAEPMAESNFVFYGNLSS